MSPRLPWLLIYIFSNIIGATIMFVTGDLIGDSAGGVVYSNSILLWATVLTVLSYYLILGPVFNLMSKIKVNATRLREPEEILGKRLGVFLFLLQIAFLVFNYVAGVNIAGSIEKTDSPFSILFVILPADALFLIYYGVFRDNKYFYPNLFAWIISNILRGWSGIFLFILFFEWCRGVRNKKITVFKTLIVLMILLAIYPALFGVKLAIRSAAGAGLSFDEVFRIIGDTYAGGNFFSLVVDGSFNLIGRIQLVSILVEVIRLRDFLQMEFINGNFTPFWLDGLQGVVWDRMLDTRSISISAMFPEYASFPGEFQLGEWSTNIGYVGWFFIAPVLIPLYLFYTLFLASLSVFLTKKISSKRSASDMLWLAWIIYLLAPWLSVFVAFIYALLVFYIIKCIFAFDLRSANSRADEAKKLELNL